MKLYYIVLITLYYTLSIKAEPFIHHPIIKIHSGLFLKLPANLQKEKFNVTYFPQQIITIQNAPKKIHYPLAKKASYLKYRFELSKPHQELELLVKKEPLGSMKNLLPQRAHPQFIHKVVRIYKKNDDNATWTPLITIPEIDALTAFTHATVHPDGTIHF